MEENVRSERVEEKGSWLEAWKDPLADLYTFSSCMDLCDLYGDGEGKLVVADLGTGVYNMKLKVYKGTALMTENTLVDLPTAVVTFQMETVQPRIPAIAVASGAYVYIYKNLRPYFKFTLPPLEMNQIEEDLWKQAKEDQISFPALREMLEGLRQEIGDMALTTRSQRFLMITDGPAMARFVAEQKSQPLKKQTVITCMTTLKKTHHDTDALSCLIIGTESSLAFVLDPEAFTILAAITLPGAPAHLHVAGLFDVEFRLVIASRDGSIAIVKRGDDEAVTVAKCPVPAVGIHVIGKTIVVPCMDNSIRCYSLLGNLLWHVSVSGAVLCSEVIEIRHLGLSALAVGLATGEVVIYRDKTLVDSFKIADGVSAMKFGRFGREDNTLVIVTKGGGLIVMMLRRQAKLEAVEDGAASLVSQQALRLNIPKKTKLFIDQTMREREDPISMHRSFQQDLYRLRIRTARAFVESLEKSANPISSDRDLPISLGAQVIGLGPTFRIRVDLTNTSCDKAIKGLAVTFNYDEKLYKVDQHYIRLPLLIPGATLQPEVGVEFISDMGISDDFQVLVLQGDDFVPKLSAIIKMPVSEVVTA